MSKREKSTPGWRKWLGRGILVVMMCAAGIFGWNYLKPLVTAEAVPIYESFIAERGDIKTTMSYSATISIINRQTVSGSFESMTSRTTVRSIDVAESQAVKEGDRLAQLSNGEILTAEIDGVVNAINYAVGDRIRGNASIMDICDFDNLQMAMSVDEYDIDALSAGQACTVTVLPLGLSFETELEHINRLSSGMGSVAYYQVTAKIDAPEAVLPGMQANVTFPDKEAINVTTLDIAALAFEEDGSAYVLRANAEGGYDKQKVETGLSDGLKVEITSGLIPGETVWAQTGTRTAEPAFTLESMYKQIVGEKIVIKDQSSRSGRGGQGSRGGMGELPEGMERPEGLMQPESEAGAEENETANEAVTEPRSGQRPQGPGDTARAPQPEQGGETNET
ncbi:MAG: HlyD family efflux transporter periplasmic adaptor subunit [Clostridia bacterium]|nr:HlyD family efflux transporter periplasmic adaptor subunit [Clostridia bacterium]